MYLSPERVRLGTPHPDLCPDCGARLLLSITGAGLGYICENKLRTGCRGNAGAHENGTPLGRAHTRDERMLCTLCHNLFDPYWKSQRGGPAGIEKRTAMMARMSEEMRKIGMLPWDQEFHFGDMNEAQLKAALYIIQTVIKKEFS